MPVHAPSLLPFDLAICGLKELRTTLAAFRATHVISISDPGGASPEIPDSLTVLRLAFWDVDSLDGMVARKLAPDTPDAYPSIAHVQLILGFGRQIPAGARVLVHCSAGISRSSATAFLIAAQAMAGSEHRAFDLIKLLRPQARPNRLIVKFGDRLLGADGRMLLCL